MGWIALVVLVVAAIVIYGVQILYIAVFTGAADDAISGSGSRFQGKTFCKPLDKKLPYYDLPVRWLVFYMNVLLPAVSIAALSGLLPDAPGEAIVADASFVAHMIFVVLALVNTVIIRGVDNGSFWVNKCFLAAWLADIVISTWGPWLGLTSIVVLPVTACSVVYFVKRRKLFFLSAKQLAAQNAL